MNFWDYVRWLLFMWGQLYLVSGIDSPLSTDQKERRMSTSYQIVDYDYYKYEYNQSTNGQLGSENTNEPSTSSESTGSKSTSSQSISRKSSSSQFTSSQSASSQSTSSQSTSSQFTRSQSNNSQSASRQLTGTSEVVASAPNLTVSITKPPEITKGCMYEQYIERVAYDPKFSGHVDVCAHFGSLNYIPFTPTDRQYWFRPSEIFSNNSKTFIDLTLGYQTIGNNISEEIAEFVYDQNNNTVNRCFAFTIFPQKSYLLENNDEAFVVCKTPFCGHYKNISSDNQNSCYCYSIYSSNTIEAKTKCLGIKGTLALISEFNDSAIMQQIGDQYLTSAPMVAFRMSVINYVSYIQKLQYEKVSCEYSENDYFLCRKQDENTSYQGCWSLPNDTMTRKLPLFSSPIMQVRNCINSCAGQNESFQFAGLRANACFCLNEKLNESSEICNISCSGNRGQACGGPKSISIYKINTLETPEDDPCSKGFVYFNGSCYYFEAINQVDAIDSQKFCLSIQSDLATIEIDEFLFIRDTIRRSDFFQNSSSFYLGGFFSEQTSKWSWRNGQPFALRLHSNFSEDRCLAYNKDTERFLIRSCLRNATVGFICKYNPQFLGFSPVLSNQSQKSFTSNWMSVTSCIQLCLNATHSQIIQVFNQTCQCFLKFQFTDLILSQTSFNCTRPIICPGHPGQICGCNNSSKASMYLVDIFETLKYQDCFDLHNNGIRVNGGYIFLKSNVSLTYTFCNFTSKRTSFLNKTHRNITYNNNCFKIESLERNNYDNKSESYQLIEITPDFNEKENTCPDGCSNKLMRLCKYESIEKDRPEVKHQI